MSLSAIPPLPPFQPSWPDFQVWWQLAKKQIEDNLTDLFAALSTMPDIADIHISADYTGTADASQFPVIVQASRFTNTTDDTANASWSFTVDSGMLTATILSGALSITAISATSEVTITSTYGGVAKSRSFTVYLDTAAPPVTGTSGGGSSYATSFTNITSATQAPVTADITVVVGASGTVTLTHEDSGRLLVQPGLQSSRRSSVARPRRVIDVTPIVSDPQNYALFFGEGGFILEAGPGASFEVHSQFTPEGRRSSFEAMRAGMDYMFTRTNAVQLTTFLPDNNPAAKGLGLKGGFKDWFRTVSTLDRECAPVSTSTTGSSARGAWKPTASGFTTRWRKPRPRRARPFPSTTTIRSTNATSARRPGCSLAVSAARLRLFTTAGRSTPVTRRSG
jgi:hypothetical protein